MLISDRSQQSISIKILPALLRCRHERNVLDSNTCYLVERNMAQIMKHAELKNLAHDVDVSSKNSIFSTFIATAITNNNNITSIKNESDILVKERDVKEPDGSSARNIFTIRSRVRNDSVWTKNQRLSIYLFSMMYSWIRCGDLQLKPDPCVVPSVADLNDDDDDHDHSNLPVSSPSSSDFDGNLPSSDDDEDDDDDDENKQVHLKAILIQYCLHILDQAAMRRSSLETPSSSSLFQNDAWEDELTEASITEVVRILDLLCLRDVSIVSELFPVVKGFCLDEFDTHIERTKSRHRTIALLSVLQFLIHHSGVVIYNVRPVLDWFFTTHLFRNGHFRTPLMAYETLLFCIRNRKALLLHTTVFEQFWPAILKLLAWQPSKNISPVSFDTLTYPLTHSFRCFNITRKTSSRVMSITLNMCCNIRDTFGFTNSICCVGRTTS